MVTKCTSTGLKAYSELLPPLIVGPSASADLYCSNVAGNQVSESAEK
jgi:hypothetical protein